MQAVAHGKRQVILIECFIVELAVIGHVDLADALAHSKHIVLVAVRDQVAQGLLSLFVGVARLHGDYGRATFGTFEHGGLVERVVEVGVIVVGVRDVDAHIGRAAIGGVHVRSVAHGRITGSHVNEVDLDILTVENNTSGNISRVRVNLKLARMLLVIYRVQDDVVWRAYVLVFGGNLGNISAWWRILANVRQISGRCEQGYVIVRVQNLHLDHAGDLHGLRSRILNTHVQFVVILRLSVQRLIDRDLASVSIRARNLFLLNYEGLGRWLGRKIKYKLRVGRVV